MDGPIHWLYLFSVYLQLDVLLIQFVFPSYAMPSHQYSKNTNHTYHHSCPNSTSVVTIALVVTAITPVDTINILLLNFPWCYSPTTPLSLPLLPRLNINLHLFLLPILISHQLDPRPMNSANSNTSK